MMVPGKLDFFWPVVEVKTVFFVVMLAPVDEVACIAKPFAGPEFADVVQDGLLKGDPEW